MSRLTSLARSYLASPAGDIQTAQPVCALIAEAPTVERQRLLPAKSWVIFWSENLTATSYLHSSSMDRASLLGLPLASAAAGKPVVQSAVWYSAQPQHSST